MRSGNNKIILLAALLAATPAVAADAPYLGDRLTIDGVTYQPADTPRLDEIGYATVLGDGEPGQHTANGEVYAPAAIGAAHRTLPLPSYVEVTAIDTGRTILVRVGDRGPMRNDRIIALTPGAAAQLGLTDNDRAAVRVRRVNPTGQEIALLAAGRPVGARMDAPPGLRLALANRLPVAPPTQTLPAIASVPALVVAPARGLGAAAVLPNRAMPPAPVIAQADAKMPAAGAKPAAADMSASVGTGTRSAGTIVVAGPPMPAARSALKPAATPSAAPAAKPAARAAQDKGGYVVQVAALSSRARAEALANTVNGFVAPAGKFYRVRTGPYAAQAEARAALGRIRAKGYADAHVVANDARTAAALAGLDPTS